MQLLIWISENIVQSKKDSIVPVYGLSYAIIGYDAKYNHKKADKEIWKC